MSCCKLRLGRVLGLASLLLLTGGPAGHAQAFTAPPVPEVFRDDPALGATISVSERRILMGDLLERLSVRLGARLQASDRIAPISGHPVTVYAREVHGWEVLDAITRTFSHPPDRWFWRRETRSGKRVYVLHNTLGPDARLRAREEFIQKFLMDQRRRISDFFKLPASARAKLAANDSFLAAMNFNPERSAGSQSIVDLLSDEQLLSVIRGETFRIPLSKLSPAQREYVNKELAMRVDPPPVEEVILARDPGTGSVMLRFGEAGGIGALGGIWSQNALKQRATDGWLGDGESQQVPDLPFPAPGANPQGDDLTLPMQPNFTTLHRVGELGRWNVVLDASEDGSYGSPRPVVHTKLADVIHTMTTYRFSLWKRHGRFFLFAPQNWEAVDRSAETPWPVVKRLRGSAASRGGFLSPADWFQLAELSRAQLQRLSHEFPDAAKVSQVQGVLRLASFMTEAEGAAAERPEGAGWEDWSRPTRQRLLTHFPPGELERVRFHLGWHSKPEARLTVYVGLGEGHPLTLPFRPREDPARTPFRPPFSPGS